MKNLLKIAIVAGVLAPGAFFLFSSSAVTGHASAIETAGNGEAVSPRSLYIQHCARCHGADGRSETKEGRRTEADDITGGTSESKLIRVITNGRGQMPGFKRKLTAAQIRQIAVYANSL